MLIIVMASHLQTSSFAQVIITGKVISKEDSLPLTGVTVRLSNTTIGTQTNALGKFSFVIPDSLQRPTIVLDISYVGYTTFKQTVDLEHQLTGTEIKIVLSESSTDLNDVVMIGYGSPKDKANRAPEFPWPPPDYTVATVLNNYYFRNARTLSDADSIIATVLDRCGYDDRSYFSIPNGFAIVTRIEQIQENGMALKDSLRWSTEVKSYVNFTWEAYFKALIFPAKGYFRIIVFAVTDQSFSSSGKQISKKNAEKWLRTGVAEMPSFLANSKYTAGYRCNAIIYEFKKEEAKEPVLLQPGILTCREHLSSAKILLALNFH